MQSLKKKFGGRVRQLRKSKRLTQEQLAAKADMEYKYLGAIERGEKNITINNIEKIANGFGIAPYQLFLFSLQGLKPEVKVTEEKIKDLLRLCNNNLKENILSIMQIFLESNNK